MSRIVDIEKLLSKHTDYSYFSGHAEYDDGVEAGVVHMMDELESLPVIEDTRKLTRVLAELLAKTDWAHCYMCTNPMKNITLDGVNNGCDGNCQGADGFSVNELITKILNDVERREDG